jgi:hypothetical protein
MGQAISYALNQWATLQRFMDHGEVEIDNNWCHAARGMNQVMPLPILCRARLLRTLKFLRRRQDSMIADAA